MSQTRPHPQHIDAHQPHSTHAQPSNETDLLIGQRSGLNARQRSVLQLQRKVGNQAVQRLLSGSVRLPVQRAVEIQELETRVGNEVPASEPAGGTAGCSNDQVLNSIKNPGILVANPMIKFDIGDETMFFPAKSVSSVSSGGAE